METIEVIQAEHNAILGVLTQLERAAGGAAAGRQVPADVFQDIREFFQVFVDRCHHSKEEIVLFPRLTEGSDGALVKRLTAEHDTGRSLAAGYAEAVQAYQPGDKTSGARLAKAAQEYAALLRSHIDLETQSLFPVVERAVQPTDREIVEGFERVEIDRIGAGVHERLHTMIEGIPARVDVAMA